MVQLAVFEDLGPGPALAGGLSPDASTMLFQHHLVNRTLRTKDSFVLGEERETGREAFVSSMYLNLCLG